MNDFIKKIEEASSYTVALAVDSFCSKNHIKPEDVQVTPIDKEKKVIVRIFDKDWTVEKSRDAEHTIYHGRWFDVFCWTCQTRSSGVLEWDDVLTDEYKYKCES